MGSGAQQLDGPGRPRLGGEVKQHGAPGAEGFRDREPDHERSFAASRSFPVSASPPTFQVQGTVAAESAGSERSAGESRRLQ